MEDREEEQQQQQAAVASNPNPNQNPARESDEPEEPPISLSNGGSFNQNEIFRAIEIVERDSSAIAQSFTSLFASLRLALSQSTTTSLHHIDSFTHASARLQESVLDAATKGNRYINSCLRLNDEMKNIDGLASQLKLLRRHVDVLDSAVNKLVHDAS